jgi:hypothetical protein
MRIHLDLSTRPRGPRVVLELPTAQRTHEPTQTLFRPPQEEQSPVERPDEVGFHSSLPKLVEGRHRLEQGWIVVRANGNAEPTRHLRQSVTFVHCIPPTGSTRDKYHSPFNGESAEPPMVNSTG